MFYVPNMRTHPITKSGEYYSAWFNDFAIRTLETNILLLHTNNNHCYTRWIHTRTQMGTIQFSISFFNIIILCKFNIYRYNKCAEVNCNRARVNAILWIYISRSSNKREKESTEQKKKINTTRTDEKSGPPRTYGSSMIAAAALKITHSRKKSAQTCKIYYNRIIIPYRLTNFNLQLILSVCNIYIYQSSYYPCTRKI